MELDFGELNLKHVTVMEHFAALETIESPQRLGEINYRIYIT